MGRKDGVGKEIAKKKGNKHMIFYFGYEGNRNNN